MALTYLDFEQAVAELEAKIEELRFVQSDSELDISDEVSRLKEKADAQIVEIYTKLTPWQISQVARHPQRPYTLDLIQMLCTDFHELHGDRSFGDDPAIVAGLARFNGRSVMVMGHQKGRDLKERTFRNFGMPRPEGYRKAERLMLLAEKFNLPILSFIDTPGAYPGIGAEERGQSEAIGRNLFVMAGLRGALYCLGDWRGWLRRSLGHCCGRSGAHAAICHLLGDLARGVCIDPLEECQQGPRGCRDTGHHGPALKDAWPD